GIPHHDTADYYRPHVTNEILREALHPYPDGLHIVTKVGAARDDAGGWFPARSPAELRSQVRDNLRNLRLDMLDVVNLRLGGFDSPEADAVEEPFGVLAELRREGLIRHLGLSTVSPDQTPLPQTIPPPDSA